MKIIECLRKKFVPPNPSIIFYKKLSEAVFEGFKKGIKK
ncbi:hypothetical protein Javan173_0020 [Streptococcus phage Javan173]|nr:hypothetical protein Javan173_0020 [Streptococcus phage Javan173]